jgi:hypothetical protein
MTTTVSKTIGTGGDFSTPQGWEDSFPASLVTADEAMVGNLFNQNFTTASGTLLTFSGTATDATRKIVLQSNAGAGFANAQPTALRYAAANGASLSSTAGYAPVISISDDNVSLIGLQVSLAASGGGTAAITCNTAANLDINGCIVESMSGAATIGVIDMFGSTQKLRNSLVVCRGSAQACIMGLKAGAQAINVTLAVPHDLTAATNAFNGSYGAASVKNCLILGATGLNSGGTTPTFTTCLTSGSTTIGVSPVVYSNGLIVDINDATRDFRLVASNHDGTTDSTNAANDIVGTARTAGAYDDGCWQFVSAGATGKPYSYYAQMRQAA